MSDLFERKTIARKLFNNQQDGEMFSSSFKQDSTNETNGNEINQVKMQNNLGQEHGECLPGLPCGLCSIL